VTAFTYQGSLKKSGSAVNGNCDFKFGLWNAQSLGTQLGVTQTLTSTVSSGLFSVKLNGGSEFGAAPFDGSPRWLAVAVRCPASSGSYTSLAPQELDAVPYALYGGAPRTFYYPLLQAQSLDLTAVYSNLRGFQGGFTDGRYGYFVGNNSYSAGKVARVDLMNFPSGGVTWRDLTAVDPDLTGFAGGFTDGRYGYIVPYTNGSGYSGKVARLDLQDFSSGTVTVLDLTTAQNALWGFSGGFTDGRYGYFVPNYSHYLARVDLQNFTTGGVTWLGLDSDLKGFAGGFTDGRYGYFVPNNNGSYFGKIARVDLTNFTTGGVTVLDLATVDSGLKGFQGGFTDGRYGYFVPYDNGVRSGKVARVDLQNFTTVGVTVLDLTAVDSDLKGFIGGFSDGRYAYFVPYSNGSYIGKAARVDLQNFAAGGVAEVDLAALDGNLKGFAGGFSDGRYGYFVPYAYGKVARIPLFFGGGAP
jgi:hypothetical protein